MMRYTKRFADGMTVCGLMEYDGYLGEAIKRLAEYEDTGLTPQEIEELKKNITK